MKLRTTIGTAVAAAAGVIAMTAAPALAATNASTVTAGTAARQTPHLTVAVNKSSVVTGHWVTVTTHLGWTATNRAVVVYAQNWATGAVKEVGSGKVNKQGNLSLSFDAVENSSIWARFAGDTKDNAVNSARVAVHASSVSVSALVGYYASTSWNGHTVREVHKAALAKSFAFVAHVYPNKSGEHATALWQKWEGSRWVNATDPTAVTLNANSSWDTGFGFTGGTPLNQKFRVTSVYGGDRGNSGSTAPWQYWDVTN